MKTFKILLLFEIVEEVTGVINISLKLLNLCFPSCKYSNALRTKNDSSKEDTCFAWNYTKEKHVFRSDLNI